MAKKTDMFFDENLSDDMKCVTDLSFRICDRVHSNLEVVDTLTAVLTFLNDPDFNVKDFLLAVDAAHIEQAIYIINKTTQDSVYELCKSMRTFASDYRNIESDD